MKNITYVIGIFLLLAGVLSCEKDFGDTGFINSDATPTDVTAIFQVAQDNSGDVTITPVATGAVSFLVYFGDDTEDSATVKPGNYVEHTYTEGNYEVRVVAVSITGKKTEATVPLDVSFNAPSNLEVTIANSQAVSKQVDVTVTADDAITYDVYFGESADEEPVSANIGETISHIYAEAGTYTITIEVKGAASETTTYTEVFEVTAIVQPTASASVPTATESNVISIFSGAYTNVAGVNYNPDWGQSGQGSSYAMFDLNGNQMLQYVNLSYQGIEFGQNIDVTQMQYLHIDIWTTDVTALDTYLISESSGEQKVTTNLTAGSWTSVDIPLSDYIDQGLTISDIFQFKFVGTPWAEGTVFIDNLYFWKEATSAFDDGLLTNGDFENGSTSWIVGVDDSSPVSVVTSGGNTYYSVDVTAAGNPWDVNMSQKVAITEGETYTLSFDAWSGTSRSIIAGIGLSGDPWSSTVETVNITTTKTTYTLTLTATGFGASNARVIFDLGAAAGSVNIDNVSLFSGAETASPVAGTWKIASEAGALMVGDGGMGSSNWWAIDASGVTTRACYFDDTYVFNTDETFQNVMDGSTWVEAWQGVSSDSCDTPVAPHNGSASATYAYNETAGTLTLSGTGAFIGLPKAYNGGELSSPSGAPSSITYDVAFVDANTMNVGISIGTGYWTFKLVKQ